MQLPRPASEPGPGQALAAGEVEAGDPGLTLAAWRRAGLHRFDPVRFRFIEALARRAAERIASQPAGQPVDKPVERTADKPAERTVEQTAGERLAQQVQQVLQVKLASLMAAYGQAQAQAQAHAQERVEHALARLPAAADTLRASLAGGDFKAVHRLIAALEDPAPVGLLADLVHRLDGQFSQPAAGRQVDPARTPAVVTGGPPVDLKAVQAFRSTWARLSVDQQLTRSLARIPEQAGPLNSQRLVLRSLQLMRDVSPAYLGRFMSYVDALLWLDEAGAPAAPAPAAAPRGDADKKRKPGRGRAG